MTQKTNTPKNIETVDEQSTVAMSHIGQDLKNAVLIVSVVINLFILTGWIALQVTSRYDTQVASILF